MAQVPLSVRQAIKRLSEGGASWPLVLTGQPGTGKTSAALCMLDWGRGIYLTAQSLCESAIFAMKGELLQLPHYEPPRDGQDRRPVTHTLLWRALEDAYLLVLDEVGMRGKVSEHHYDCVKRAIDAREGRPLVVISNLSLPELLPIYDDRIISRLAGGTVVPVYGPDRRLK